jgi:hypothetical protein
VWSFESGEWSFESGEWSFESGEWSKCGALRAHFYGGYGKLYAIRKKDAEI